MRYDLLHPKALHKALVEHLGTAEGVPQERQVRRWVSGDTPVPQWARRIIDEIMEAPAQQEAAPRVGTLERRLLTGVLALERKTGVSAEELATAEAEAMVLVAHLLGGDGKRPRQSGGGGAGGAAD